MTNGDTRPAIERFLSRVNGIWVFRGTRVPANTILDRLKNGAMMEQFLEWFPIVGSEQY